MILSVFLVIILLKVHGGFSSTFYISHSPYNNSCFDGGRKVSPCMRLQTLSTCLTQQNITCLRIYFVDQNYSIGETILFTFPRLMEFKMMPISKRTIVDIHCENDLSFSYAGVQTLEVIGMRFYKCGNAQPIFSLEGDTSISELATFRDVSFIQSRRNSVRITQTISQVIVANCSFNEAQEDDGFYLHSPTATSLFSGTVFNNNLANSVTIIAAISANFSDCTFFNNSGSSITLDTVNTTISHSSFNNNQETPITVRYNPRYGRNIYGRNINYNFTISSSSFISNSAISGGVMHVNCPCKMKVLHSIFVDNHASDSGGVAHLFSTSAAFVNCSFMNNSASRGTGGAITTFKRNRMDFVKVINCTFEGNQARVAGALHIYRSMNITIDQCQFIENTAASYGGALVAISGYTDGSSLSVTSCNVQGNSAAFHAGAFYIKDVAIVTMQDCYFAYNQARFEAGALHISVSDLGASNRMLLSRVTFTSNHADEGGAIKLEQFYNSSVLNCSFTNNTARYGGALQAFSPVPGPGPRIVVMLSISGSYFCSNRADIAGGAITSDSYNIFIFMSSFLSNEAKRLGGAIRMNFTNDHRDIVDRTRSSLTIKYSSFDNNTAFSGGAVAIDYLIVTLSFYKVSFFGNGAKQEGGAAHINISTSINQFTITHCDFIGNEVTNEMGRGGAIATHNEQIHILSTNFRDNRAQYGGAIFSQNTSQLALQESYFNSNQAVHGGGGAIFSDTTSVRVYSSTFLQNIALNYGGGLALSLSHVYFSGHSEFHSNEVKSTFGKGGGIYVADRRENCSINSCLLSWANRTRVDFTDNIARQGEMLYGGMLDRCNLTTSEELESQPAQVLYSNGAPYQVNTYGITSDGVQFCYCSKKEPQCLIRRRVRTAYPGQTLMVYAACVDQMQQIVPCYVRSEYQNTDFQLGQGQSVQILTHCQPLNFTSYTRTDNFTSLTITGEILCDQRQWNTLELDITTVNCPKGFERIIDKCECDNRIANVFPNAVCNIDEVRVQINQLGWLGYDEEHLRVLNICPLNYCSTKKQGINPSEPDAQCNYNHGGILCGGCLPNHSVILGSWKCMDCSHLARYNFIWLTALLALAGVVLVVFLLLVKLTVSSGTINGLIFYANVLSLSGLLDYPVCPVHPVLRVFVSWLNLDLGIEVCFYSGMDVYQKTWLQYVFPFYVWGLVGAIAVLCHFSPTVMRAMGRRNIEVLATLFLLSYTKILKAIITAFSFTNLSIANATDTSDPLVVERVWVYDGKIPFLSQQHLPLFIISLLVLILLFFPYTFFLTFGQCVRSIQRRRILKWTRSIYFVTIIDSYHAPYKNHHRYWTGLCLLVRCILFTIFGTSYSTESNLLWIALVVGFLVVVRVCIGVSIYNSKMVDLLELSFLVNLGVLAILLQRNNEYCLSVTVSVSLSLITFVGMLIGHCHLEMRKNCLLYDQCLKNVQKVFNQKPPQEDLQDINDVPALLPESHSTTYINYRESLLSI